ESSSEPNSETKPADAGMAIGKEEAGGKEEQASTLPTASSNMILLWADRWPSDPERMCWRYQSGDPRTMVGVEAVRIMGLSKSCPKIDGVYLDRLINDALPADIRETCASLMVAGKLSEV